MISERNDLGLVTGDVDESFELSALCHPAPQRPGESGSPERTSPFARPS